MTVIYGIPNCDKCSKARKWFEGNELNHSFHDLRTDGLNAAMISAWLKQTDADALLNRRSTTWRGLSNEQRDAAISNSGLTQLLIQHPTLLKRPLVDTGATIIVGYDETAWLESLS